MARAGEGLTLRSFCLVAPILAAIPSMTRDAGEGRGRGQEGWGR